MLCLAHERVQEDLDVPLKMKRLRQWCEDINRVQNEATYDFLYVDQENFEKYRPTSFSQLLEGFREFKEEIIEARAFT